MISCCLHVFFHFINFTLLVHLIESIFKKGFRCSFLQTQSRCSMNWYLNSLCLLLRLQLEVEYDQADGCVGGFGCLQKSIKNDSWLDGFVDYDGYLLNWTYISSAAVGLTVVIPLETFKVRIIFNSVSSHFFNENNVSTFIRFLTSQLLTNGSNFVVWDFQLLTRLD